MFTTKETFDIIKSEYDELSKRIYKLMLHQERLLNYSLLILVIISTYGSKSNFHNLDIFYPLGIFVVYFYSLYYLTQIHALGGYRKFLEDNLNSFIKKNTEPNIHNIFIWEKFARKRLQFDINYYVQVSIYFFVLIMFIIMAFRSANMIFQYIICSFYIIFTIILVISLIRAVKMFPKTYKFYKNNK